jgi:hypothetical protein
MAESMGQVVLAAGDQVVEDDDLVPGLEQAIGQMRSKKPGSAGDETAHRSSSSAVSA